MFASAIRSPRQAARHTQLAGWVPRLGLESRPEQDPVGFSLMIGSEQRPDVGTDLVAIALTKLSADALSDKASGSELAKLADAALAKLNARLPEGFGSLEATIITDARLA